MLSAVCAKGWLPCLPLLFDFECGGEVTRGPTLDDFPSWSLSVSSPTSPVSLSSRSTVLPLFSAIVLHKHRWALSDRAASSLFVKMASAFAGDEVVQCPERAQRTARRTARRPRLVYLTAPSSSLPSLSSRALALHSSFAKPAENSADKPAFAVATTSFEALSRPHRPLAAAQQSLDITASYSGVPLPHAVLLYCTPAVAEALIGFFLDRIGMSPVSNVDALFMTEVRVCSRDFL
jgi:hypothetical protein